MKKYVIFAPHVDDEVIGCWSLLDQGQVQGVVYFSEYEGARYHEALASARKYKFIPFFADHPFDFDRLKEIVGECIVCAPGISDTHPEHRAVNRVAKIVSGQRRMLFYSVDMNRDFVGALDSEDAFKKKAALYELFPSQKELFDSDQKYYLFEATLSDEDNKGVRVFKGSGEIVVKTKVPFDHELVMNTIDKYREKSHKQGAMRDLIDELAIKAFKMGFSDPITVTTHSWEITG